MSSVIDATFRGDVLSLGVGIEANQGRDDIGSNQLAGPHTGYRRTIGRSSRNTTTTIAATAKRGKENTGLNGRW